MFHVSFMFHVSCLMFHDVTGGSNTSFFSSPRVRADSKISVIIKYFHVSPGSARRGRGQGSGRSFTDLLQDLHTSGSVVDVGVGPLGKGVARELTAYTICCEGKGDTKGDISK